jgi:hypothetical protein
MAVELVYYPVSVMAFQMVLIKAVLLDYRLVLEMDYQMVVSSD